jgi:hypothetical protein
VLGSGSVDDWNSSERLSVTLFDVLADGTVLSVPRFTTSTERAGKFLFHAVPIGAYLIEIRLAGSAVARNHPLASRFITLSEARQDLKLLISRKRQAILAAFPDLLKGRRARKDKANG